MTPFGDERRGKIPDRKLFLASVPPTGSTEKELCVQRRELTITNRLGLHGRAAAKLVTLCSRYKSQVMVFANGRRADGRHMIALLMLSAAMGTVVSIEASGPDEKQAISAVAHLMSDLA
jgi:phosphocarrier protein HPr